MVKKTFIAGLIAAFMGINVFPTAWADECKNVNTSEFQGTICNGTRVQSQYGRFFLPGEGVFEGRMAVYSPFFLYEAMEPNQSHLNNTIINSTIMLPGKLTMKRGRLTSPTFQGSVYFKDVSSLKIYPTLATIIDRIINLISGGKDESKPPINSTYSYMKETMSGKWLISPALKLGGTIILERRGGIIPEGNVTVFDNRTEMVE